MQFNHNLYKFFANFEHFRLIISINSPIYVIRIFRCVTKKVIPYEVVYGGLLLRYVKNKIDKMDKSMQLMRKNPNNLRHLYLLIVQNLRYHRVNGTPYKPLPPLQIWIAVQLILKLS